MTAPRSRLPRNTYLFTSITKTMSDQKNARVKMSGLWKSTTKDGTTYLSGSSGGQRWSIWPNGYREENDKAPTHILYVEQVQKREDSSAGASIDSLDDI